MAKAKAKTVAPGLSIAGVDLEGKHVWMPESHDIGHVFLCTGGFGCSPEAAGNCVGGKWVAEGDGDRVERYEVDRLATPGEIEFAKWLNAEVPMEEQRTINVAAKWQGILNSARDLCRGKKSKQAAEKMDWIISQLTVHADWFSRGFESVLHDPEFDRETLHFDPRMMGNLPGEQHTVAWRIKVLRDRYEAAIKEDLKEVPSA